MSFTKTGHTSMMRDPRAPKSASRSTLWDFRDNQQEHYFFYPSPAALEGEDGREKLYPRLYARTVLGTEHAGIDALQGVWRAVGRIAPEDQGHIPAAIFYLAEPADFDGIEHLVHVFDENALIRDALRITALKLLAATSSQAARIHVDGVGALLGEHLESPLAKEPDKAPTEALAADIEAYAASMELALSIDKTLTIDAADFDDDVETIRGWAEKVRALGDTIKTIDSGASTPSPYPPDAVCSNCGQTLVEHVRMSPTAEVYWCPVELVVADGTSNQPAHRPAFRLATPYPPEIVSKSMDDVRKRAMTAALHPDQAALQRADASFHGGAGQTREEAIAEALAASTPVGPSYKTILIPVVPPEGEGAPGFTRTITHEDWKDAATIQASQLPQARRATFVNTEPDIHSVIRDDMNHRRAENIAKHDPLLHPEPDILCEKPVDRLPSWADATSTCRRPKGHPGSCLPASKTAAGCTCNSGGRLPSAREKCPIHSHNTKE